MKIENSQDWFDYAKLTFEMISREMDAASDNQNLYEIYPQLVVQLEFFGQIRGEGFFYSRPHGIEKQNEIFDMEAILKEKIVGLSAKLDPNDERVVFCLEQMKKSFEITND